MNFSYETQGAITYLVCELAPTDQLDTLTLGMLTNNHIAGFAPVLYTEMNGQRFLKYNISAKVSAAQFFSGTMNKQRALTAFDNILSAICSADEYMIDPNCFSVVPEHVFLNVSSCETALLCIPVLGDKDINAAVAEFFKKIVFSTQFDNGEDASYITQLITYINSGAGFSVYGLKDLVDKLQAGVPTGIQVPPAAPVMQQAAPAMPQAAPVIPQAAPAAPVQQTSVTPAAPVSSFDSTITIDQMPEMMAQRQAQQAQQAQPPVFTPPMPAKPPVAPPARPAQQPMQPPMPPAGGRPMNNVPPVQNNRPPQGGFVPAGAPNNAAPKFNGMPKPPVAPPAGVPKPPVVPPVGVPKPPVAGGPGFAIPGQPMGGVAKPPVPQAPARKPQPNAANAANAANAGDKKMSLFGLLSHYTKENAELYKKQKEEEKAKKNAATANPVQRPVQPPVGAPRGAMPPQPNPAQRPPVGAPGQQFTAPQYQPPVQPVPVQNSFNETTVLSPAMMGGGETTVLSAAPVMPNPTLTRVKTGEKVSINKPVFRIGKEKSYVDYFIADNTAISRSHANIHTENGQYFIEDTNSTNHTYINGKLINSNVKTKLTSGDKVRLANEDFTFSV